MSNVNVLRVFPGTEPMRDLTVYRQRTERGMRYHAEVGYPHAEPFDCGFSSAREAMRRARERGNPND